MRVFLHELRAQQLIFWRNREAAFFTFLFPILLLVLIGSVYGDEPIEGVDAPTFLLVGLLGYGVAANAFAGLAITLVVRREAGVLKRVRGTPLGPGTYLAAVIGSTLVVIGLEVVAQLLLGVYILGAEWPDQPMVFAAAILVGTAAFAALGIAVTTAVKTAEGSSAVVNAIFLPMAFISGVFFSTAEHARLPRGDLASAAAHVPARADPRCVPPGRGVRALRPRRGVPLGPRRLDRGAPAVSLGAQGGRRERLAPPGPASVVSRAAPRRDPRCAADGAASTMVGAMPAVDSKPTGGPGSRWPRRILLLGRAMVEPS